MSGWGAVPKEYSRVLAMSTRDLVCQVTGSSSPMAISLQPYSANGTKLSAFSAPGSVLVIDIQRRRCCHSLGVGLGGRQGDDCG